MPLRIIAGQYKRRKLRTNPGKTTRPISDRMKESLFHLLDGAAEDARVADVFAGTGTLGLECLSRGAEFCVFYESDRKAHELLRENVDHVGVSESSLCWKVDVRRTSFTPKNAPLALPYSLVFFDPPYKLATDLTSQTPLGSALRRLSRESVTEADATLVVRTASEYPLQLSECWEVVEETRIASSRISICRKSSSDSAKAPKVD